VTIIRRTEQRRVRLARRREAPQERRRSLLAGLPSRSWRQRYRRPVPSSLEDCPLQRPACFEVEGEDFHSLLNGAGREGLWCNLASSNVALSRPESRFAEASCACKRIGFWPPTTCSNCAHAPSRPLTPLRKVVLLHLLRYPRPHLKTIYRQHAREAAPSHSSTPLLHRSASPKLRKTRHGCTLPQYRVTAQTLAGGAGASKFSHEVDGRRCRVGGAAVAGRNGTRGSQRELACGCGNESSVSAA
jgi:hypothetical protein